MAAASSKGLTKEQQKMTAGLVVYGGTLLALLIPFYVWADLIDWNFNNTSALTIFPLLGLWAYFQMWLHFMVVEVRRQWPTAFNYKKYYQYTGYLVLTLLLLHPALLLYVGNLGNYTPLDYVGKSKEFFILLAYFAITVFIAYEFFERMKDRPLIKKHWGIVKAFNIAAMVAIFFHSINLGQHLQAGWFRGLWLIMFAVFIGVILRGYIFEYQDSLNKKS